MTNLTSNEKKVQNLSQEQAIVLLALMNNAQDVAGGDFGFIQEASHYQTVLNKHQFAGHLAHLGSFMGMCYDCSKDFDLDTNDMQFTLQDWIWEFRAEIEKKTETPVQSEEEAQEEVQVDHHCIIQQSSNLILTVGETAQEAVNEYNSLDQEEKTVSDFSSSFYGNDNIILLPCTKFVHDKALSSGDETSYFYNGFEIDSYIETVEDFDSADTALSSEYNESSPCLVFFDSYSNIFNLKEFLLETAVNYDCPLEYEDVSNIALELEAHFECESTQDYDHVVFAKCTESNDYPEGEFKQDGESYYTLSFSRSNAVLILKKG